MYMCVCLCVCILVTLCRALLTKFAKWLQTPPMGGNPPGLRHTHKQRGRGRCNGTWDGAGGWGLCWLCEREFNVLGTTATIMQFSEMRCRKCNNYNNNNSDDINDNDDGDGDDDDYNDVNNDNCHDDDAGYRIDSCAAAAAAARPASCCIRGAIKLIKPTKRKFEVEK